MKKNALSKAELMQIIADKCDLTKKDVSSVVSTLFETITSEVSKGNEINIIGFGKFHSSKREARKGRNPKSGEVINIPAAVIPKFSAGKSFKDQVNK